MWVSKEFSFTNLAVSWLLNHQWNLIIRQEGNLHSKWSEWGGESNTTALQQCSFMLETIKGIKKLNWWVNKKQWGWKVSRLQQLKLHCRLSSLNIPTEIPALIINLTAEPIWNVGLDHWVRYKSHTTAFPDQLLFLSHTGRGQKGQAPRFTANGSGIP